MQSRLTAFLVSLCLIFTCTSLPAQQPWVDIHIIQGDESYNPGTGKDSITLERKAFKIQVLLQHIKGVYLFASFSDSLYKLEENMPVPGFAELPSKAMAEEEFNKEKELIVDDGGWSYWFFDPAMTWHRFNKKIILLDSDRVVGTKTIKQLYFPPSKETVKLKDNRTALYLFFTVVKDETPDGKPGNELLRRRVKIDWRDEE